MNSEKASPAAELLTELIEGFCKYPADCRIAFDEQRGGWEVLSVFPHAADRPLFIGGGGRTIKSLQIIAAKMGFQLKLEEPITGEREPIQPFTPDPAFDIAQMQRFIERFCLPLFGSVPRITTEWRGNKLFYVLDIGPHDNGALQILDALDNAIFPYAKRKGCTVNLSPFKPKPKQ